jgi:2-polyprenyl-6-methoxyphenol hydroxylase-like FAD-dependent oxidoreductase
MRIGIVGAGFGGCASALALARDGHQVTLLEAVERPMPVGAGIMLQPSGMAVLAELGVLERVLQHGEPCDRLRCVTRHGRLVFDLPYAVWDARLFGLGLHRGALFSALYDALPAAGVRLELGVLATAIEGEHVRDAAGCKHGPFELIVIADGARSRLRAALGHALRDDEYPWGALWTVAADPERRFRGRLFQVVDGAKAMLGLLPTGTRPGDDTPQVSLFISVRLDQLPALRARGFAAFKADSLAFAPDCAPVLDQLESFEQLLVASYRDVRLPRLDFGRVVYVGDAGHAMSPQLGQGSNLALLDALALAASLREQGELGRALAAYSRARRSQLRYYQFVNRALTPFFQGDSWLLGALRDALMPLAARLPLLRSTMVATMCGVKGGFMRRSLPIAHTAKLLPASTELARSSERT